MIKLEVISKKIREIREQMNELIEHRDLTDAEVVLKSQELDILIYEYTKERILKAEGRDADVVSN